MCSKRFFIVVLLFVSPVFGINDEIVEELVRFFQRRYEIEIHADGRDNLYLFFQVKKWLGTPFRLYEKDRNKGIGEMELLNEISKNAFCKSLPDSIPSLIKKVTFRKDTENPVQGDILFFSYGKGVPNHIGIYLKDNYFLQVEAMQGVVIESLEKPYYRASLYGVGKLPCIRNLGENTLSDFLDE